MLEYKRKFKSEGQISSEERQEIAERIIKFMRESLRISDYTSICKDTGKKYKNFYFVFCGSQASSFYDDQVYENSNFEITDERLLNFFDCVIFERFKYHIRMNASIRHIKKFIEIFGKRFSFYMLNEWAKKNMAVALVLNKVCEELLE